MGLSPLTKATLPPDGAMPSLRLRPSGHLRLIEGLHRLAHRAEHLQTVGAGCDEQWTFNSAEGRRYLAARWRCLLELTLLRRCCRHVVGWRRIVARRCGRRRFAERWQRSASLPRSVEREAWRVRYRSLPARSSNSPAQIDLMFMGDRLRKTCHIPEERPPHAVPYNGHRDARPTDCVLDLLHPHADNRFGDDRRGVAQSSRARTSRDLAECCPTNDGSASSGSGRSIGKGCPPISRAGSISARTRTLSK